jgi:glucose-1-phosphatase
MIKAIIFDCFGVLITDALGAMTTELCKTNPDAKAQIHAWLHETNTGKITAEESAKRISAIFGLSYEDYRQQLSLYEVKNQELLDYALELRKTYRTAVLSNVSSWGLERRFSKDELGRYFDVVVASGEIGYVKPEARAYEIVAERLDVRLDECIFTDDLQPYLDGAQAVGIQTILYQNFPQFRTDLERLLANSQ